MSETVDEIALRLNNIPFTQHAVLNVAKLVYMQKNSRLRDAVLACDIINIDGMGLVWAGRLLGFDVPERVTGIDLFFKLLDLASERGDSVFLLGARQQVVEQAVKNIREDFPELKVAGYHHGYFWEYELDVVNLIRSSGAKFLFVGISSPAKEEFINRWREKLGVRFAMGVGGTFDIVAGITKRAPMWMQRNGLEWFHRLVQDPKRMWKRYLITNIKFALLLTKEILNNSSN
jgi:N-acetylglucosaminyldiphosphoundecaprenol N-acetyl-beta-D-mannosaminyltransferase